MKKSKRFSVQIWTDGSCLRNPGVGGWAAVLVYGNHGRVLSGWAERATNNNMETKAVLAALQALKAPCRVELYTDSQYVVHGMRRVINGREMLKTNQELWAALRKEAVKHSIKVIRVDGHVGHKMNELADLEAFRAANVQDDRDQTHEDIYAYAASLKARKV